MLRTRISHHEEFSRARFFIHAVRLICLGACFVTIMTRTVSATNLDDTWHVGVAKADITPTEPLRLSGYAVRSKPFTGIDDPLAVRALAMRHNDGRWLVIVSIDSIGLSAQLTDRIMTDVRKTHGLERSQIVLCCTHSHTAPHLTGGLVNLFTEALSEKEQTEIDRYTDRVVSTITGVIASALSSPKQARIEFGESQAGFAINRRVVKDGTATGFGVQDAGPVDRTVRILKATSMDGKSIAVAYQYACHCTSISPELNRVSSDWAGLSATAIEKALPGAIALPIIGCGADANPNPRGTYENAKDHGQELSKSVLNALTKGMTPLPPLDKSVFSYVALAYERPTREQLESQLKSDQPQQHRFAESMLAVWDRMGRIPETYPAPVHLVRFGNELAWVFLGGEVVVDYQIRLLSEVKSAKHVWVAAYTDDVFAYLASERVRREGGYEVDGSMLYYNRPGRWESGTEEVVIGRIKELEQQTRSLDEPRTPAESLALMQVAPGFRLEQIACEPQVQDPINFAFDAKGRAWVVEMGDYPLGGGLGGRIKILEDQDHDGKYETAKIFMSGLEYPAGVYPWRDGAIIACAPEVFWARDTNGDDVADEKEILITGFALGNPQHRVHGFSYGLDHRLHFGIGMEIRQVTTPKNGEALSVAGSDLSLDVDRGSAQLEAGPSQFIRSQDDWGHWFANDNTHPLFHFVFEDRYTRNAARMDGPREQQVFHPASAPEVFPLVRDTDRFNDLFTANRFTSACSGIICRSSGLGPNMSGSVLVCEPVHNLVSRAMLTATGTTFRASRFPQDTASEWLRSEDTWFRPTRVENAPDGTLWIADMYRRVIEHPEWIPEDWQARIDVRAGEGMGRIYRVFADGVTPSPMPDLTQESNTQLIERLADGNSAIRDLAQQQLIFRKDESILPTLAQTSASNDSAFARLHALAVLRATGWLDFKTLQVAMRDRDPRVARPAIRWSEEFPQSDFGPTLGELAKSDAARESADLALQILLTSQHQELDNGMARLVALHPKDEWILRSVRMLPEEQVDRYVSELTGEGQGNKIASTFANAGLDELLAELLPATSEVLRKRLLAQLNSHEPVRPAWHFILASGLQDHSEQLVASDAFQRILKSARQLSSQDNSDPALVEAAVRLLSSRADREHHDDQSLLMQLALESKQERIRQIALDGLQRIGDPAIASELISQWNRLSPQGKSSLIQQLTSNSQWLPTLIDALEQKRLGYADLDPLAVERLLELGDKDLRARCESLLKTLSQELSTKDPARSVVEMLQRFPDKGDRDKGAKIFERHCAICHRDRERQTAVGPNLASLRDWTDQAWLVAILDPNRAVEARYRRVTVATDDGVIRTGLLSAETDQWSELTTADGQRIRIQKSEIEALRETDKSLMPEGFGQFMSPQDLKNLVAYLRAAES